MEEIHKGPKKKAWDIKVLYQDLHQSLGLREHDTYKTSSTNNISRNALGLEGHHHQEPKTFPFPPPQFSPRDHSLSQFLCSPSHPFPRLSHPRQFSPNHLYSR